MGFRAALARFHLVQDDHLIFPGNATVEAARDAALKLFALKDRPTAIATGNNLATIGVMQAIRAAGLRVPRDVAIAGFDDFEWAEFFAPRLTAVEQDLTAMGASSVAMLLARIADPAAATRRVRVAPAFHHRDSCGCHKQPSDE